MIVLEPPIQQEFERTLAALGSEPDLGIGYLSSADVLRAHFYIANHFYLEGTGLGGLGPRDTSLLHSAVARQAISFDGRLKWTDRFDICATLFYGLIMNHAFHDANKRTAFLSVLFLLFKYGWCPAVSEKEFEDFTVEIADNKLEKYARFEKLKREKVPDPEVRFISWYLRKNTRRFDKAHYAVTYRELQTILNSHGYVLSNPHNNRIDVAKKEVRNRLFGLLGKEEVELRLAQIGFPRWGAQVGKSALKTVREATKLDADNGVDSAAFFKGLDPMQTLIATYNEPLMNLAHR